MGVYWVVFKPRIPKNPRSNFEVFLQGGSSSSGFLIWDSRKEFPSGGFEIRVESRVSYDQIGGGTEDRRFSFKINGYNHSNSDALRGWALREKAKNKKNIPGTQPKARTGWPKRLRLVQATP